MHTWKKELKCEAPCTRAATPRNATPHHALGGTAAMAFAFSMRVQIQVLEGVKSEPSAPSGIGARSTVQAFSVSSLMPA